LPEADIQHVGSCAVPGALAKFDIDIQIRVKSAHFNKVVGVMENNFFLKHQELWTDEFAIFKKNSEPPFDYMVTVIDSRYDDFFKVRDFFLANPEMLQEYNKLKKECEGKIYSEYRDAKKAFLGGNGKVRFLKY
jgi:GrpB-like predicted nucleotidyltransferase (UPF0157 family)